MTELVEGETLAERIARGPIPWDEARALFTQIAEAIEAAHGKGVLHRDLKPANIMITPDGRIKILDFGLAKALQEDNVHVESSQSPTRTRGTALGDIWAFGCCLYEALTKPRHRFRYRRTEAPGRYGRPTVASSTTWRRW